MPSALARLPLLDDPSGCVGTELNGKWTLVRLLGVGGTSAVYEAVHRNGRHAAVKLLASSAARDRGQALELAALESRLCNQIDHPGVVAILDDAVAEDGTPYLVMELLDGETLEGLRARSGGRLTVTQALPILRSLLEVLEALHARGIVHRDIKPDNVFVLASGQVKLVDFGLAIGKSESVEASAWFGTPGFMSPEQARGSFAEVDARSDLWAAAATFYSVVSGSFVHRGDTCEALVRAAAREEVELDAEGIPLGILDCLERALAFDRADRLPSARAMLAALRSAEARPVRGPRRIGAALPAGDSRARIFELVPTPSVLRPKRPAESGTYARFDLAPPHGRDNARVTG